MRTVESKRPRWLNGIVLGIGLASLFSDWLHEIETRGGVVVLSEDAQVKP